MKQLFAFLFFTAPLFGAAPIMTLDINPKVIGTNEAALVELSIQGEDLSADPEPPVSPAFQLSFAGRGQQSMASFANGAVAVKNIYTYTYRLTPKQPGSHVVAAFKVRTKSGTYYSPSAQISIQNKDAVRAPVRRQVFNPFASFSEEPGETFFSFRFSRQSPIQNTPFVADLYIVAQNPAFLEKLNLETDLRLLYRPNFDGGVLHEMAEIPDQPIVENFYAGGAFAGRLFKRYIGYPLSSEKAVLRAPVYQLRSGLFDFYIQGEPEGVPVIPAPRGLGYIGTTLKASLTLGDSKPRAGKDTVLTLTIEGDGNADYFADPFSVQKIEGLYISQPKAEIMVGLPSEGSVYMVKKFTYNVSPQKEGSYTLPPVALPYTTPEGEGRTVTTPALTFEALPAEAGPAAPALAPLPVPKGDYAYYSGLGALLAAWVLGLALMAWAGWTASRRRRLSTDEIYARKQGAKKRLHSVLGEAEFALKVGKYREAARLLRQSLMGYAADKLGLPLSASPGEIARALDDALAPSFLNLAGQLTSAAFGEEPQASTLTDCLGQAQEVLDGIDAQKNR